ncbi:hypothetical protein [Rhodococcus sp. (in: high G+C Gram-positive bacteria)]|uniref:hypothetical protein n=1 Tax=Rhodococcus sp. TaxID=1831 RepID=UPI001A1A5468|nr:hypothetical protein [Rhodococcus sp. (in: high G+C Gram-positive bacteria)]MBJ7480895.1 hypothetical protein [Rhodococcus sp. (in: high G+C Gram-positive bacteria)]
MTDTWLPLGVAEDDADYSVLFEHVTNWLRPSLHNWVETAVSGPPITYPTYVDLDVIRTLEMLLRFNASPIVDSTPAPDAAGWLLAEFGRMEKIWQLVDALLASKSGDRAKLLRILVDSGSAWTVGERSGKPGLVRRVNEGTDTAVHETIAKRGHAGKRLAEAYHAAYGVNPDPSRAYSLAVKAVEDAGKPIVSPNNAGTTLGTMIRDISSTAKWKLPHTRIHPNAEPRDVLLGMMQMLWTGQHDRHGGATPPVPPVSQEEAETAVMVAATLVELFCSGKVVKDT